MFVIKTPPALRLHLCAPAIRPAATGVNAISDTPEMDLPVTKCDLEAFSVIDFAKFYFNPFRVLILWWVEIWPLYMKEMSLLTT